MSLKVQQADKDNAEVRYWISTPPQFHLDKYLLYLKAWGCGVTDPVDSILEIGIGPYSGFLPLMVARRKVGLDPCISRYRNAGVFRECPGVGYVDSHLEEFETAEKFERIVTADVLDHGALGFHCIPGIVAMLKPGGKLYIHVQLRTPHYLNSIHDHCLTLDQLDEALKRTTLIEERRDVYPRDITEEYPYGAVVGVWRRP